MQSNKFKSHKKESTSNDQSTKATPQDALAEIEKAIVAEAKLITSGQKTSAYQLQLLCRKHDDTQLEKLKSTA